jgi:hypothetical protein
LPREVGSIEGASADRITAHKMNRLSRSLLGLLLLRSRPDLPDDCGEEGDGEQAQSRWLGDGGLNAELNGRAQIGANGFAIADGVRYGGATGTGGEESDAGLRGKVSSVSNDAFAVVKVRDDRIGRGG